MIKDAPVLKDGSGWNPIPHNTARDPRLDRRAVGLLVEILSYPPGWHITSKTLTESGAEGRDAVRAALKALVDAGYVVHVKHRGERGRYFTASFAGNTPEVARGLADEWERSHSASETESPCSHRGTGYQAPVNQDSVNQASADQTSVNQALIRRRGSKTERETEEKEEDQNPAPTEEQSTPAPARTREPDPNPPWVTPAESAPADQAEPEPEEALPLEDPPTRAGACSKCGHPLTHYMHDVMCGDPKAAAARFVGHTRPAENTP